MSAREVRKLVNQFGIPVKGFKRVVKGVYQVQSLNGDYFALKSMTCSSAQLQWIDKALCSLRSAGFSKISWRDPSRAEGKKLYVQSRSGTRYILTPWIQGKWPSPRSPEDMKSCGIILADFYRKGSIAISHQGERNMLGKWPSELHMQHVKLKKLISKSKKRPYPKRLRLFLQSHGEEILNYATEARSMLQNSLYRKESNKARRQPHVCHGDGGPSNFILSQNSSYLIDFETLRIDLRAYDLYRVIFNSCKDHGWRFSIAKSILDGYQTVSYLTSTDFSLVKVWLRFPQTTYLLLRGHYVSSRAQIAAGMHAALQAERRITAFLKELDKYSSFTSTEHGA